MDSLLLTLDLLWVKSNDSFGSEDLHRLKNEAVALDRRFSKWQQSRSSDFKPTVIGHVDNSQNEWKAFAGYWPGKVDTYFDLYVAGVWNIFRAARLLLFALIIELAKNVGDVETHHDHIHIANSTVEDIAASIPYHLADNLQVFMSEVTKNVGISEPGKLLGGLLLMHPLYVASSMPFLCQNMREYLRQCLLWIGSNMGLGQATLLATVS